MRRRGRIVMIALEFELSGYAHLSACRRELNRIREQIGKHPLHLHAVEIAFQMVREPALVLAPNATTPAALMATSAPKKLKPS